MRERPILFSGEMVRAILDNRKTMTRRVVKPQPEWWEALHPVGKYQDVGWRWKGWKVSTLDDDYTFRKILVDNGPYCVGQELWVRETWAMPVAFDHQSPSKVRLKVRKDVLPNRFYRADESAAAAGAYIGKRGRWRPSIFMPKWACRLRLRVTDVRVERVQEISEEDADAEIFGGDIPHNIDGPHKRVCKTTGPYYYNGVCIEAQECACGGYSIPELFSICWDSINAKPKPIYHDGAIVSYVSYPWEDIQETREYRGKPWLIVGNPWVWCISFERTDKP